MTFKTKYPEAFSQFFSQINNEEFNRKKSLFESCHGIIEETDVIFFEEKPGACATELKSDTSFAEIVSYNFSDAAITKECIMRQLLVTVKLA